jgi:hypothetical protein
VPSLRTPPSYVADVRSDDDQLESGRASRLACTVSGTGDDGELRRLVISALDGPESRVVVELPDGPAHFTAEGRDLILQAVTVTFKSLRSAQVERRIPRALAEAAGRELAT